MYFIFKLVDFIQMDAYTTTERHVSAIIPMMRFT